MGRSQIRFGQTDLKTESLQERDHHITMLNQGLPGAGQNNGIIQVKDDPDAESQQKRVIGLVSLVDVRGTKDNPNGMAQN